jgi:hypothetical protein
VLALLGLSLPRYQNQIYVGAGVVGVMLMVGSLENP